MIVWNSKYTWYTYRFNSKLNHYLPSSFGGSSVSPDGRFVLSTGQTLAENKRNRNASVYNYK